MPLTENIAVTKQLCDKLGENIKGVECSEYYQKTNDILQEYKGKHKHTKNISKEEWEEIKTLKENDTHIGCVCFSVFQFLLILF